MKKINITLSLLLFLLVRVNYAHADVCPGVTIVYPRICDSSVCADPIGAFYGDDTNDSASYFLDGEDLVVVWPHNGPGRVEYLTDDGEPRFVPVTVSSSIVFTAAPQVFCSSETFTYSVTDDCGTSFTWTVPSGWSINGGGTTLTTSSKSISVTAPATTQAIGTITVVSNISGTISQKVVSGNPGSGITSVVEDNRNNHTVYNFIATPPSPGATAYNWYVDNTLTSTTTENNFEWFVLCNQSKTFKCTVTNRCKTSGFSGVLTRTGACSFAAQSIVSLSPNPASSQLNISMLQASSTSPSAVTDNESPDLAFEARLYSASGKLLKTGGTTAGTMTFDIQDLPAGEYYVHIHKGAEIISEHVLIRR